MTAERDLIEELSLKSEGNTEERIPNHIIARYSEAPATFNQNEPVLSIVKLISTQNWHALEQALINHYDRIKNEKILPLVLKHLQLSPLLPETLELLALLHYEHQYPVNWSVLDLKTINFAHYATLRETSQETTNAGYKLGNEKSLRYPNRSFGSQKAGYLSSRPWVLECFIVSEANSSRAFVDSWWPFVIPALLNFLDTSELSTKLRGIKLVTQLAVNHAEKLRFSGLAPVFENSIQPCLSFLPPLVDPAQTKLIYRPAMEGLVELARITSQTQPLEYAKRLNFLAREGCIKPFSHANEKVDLHQYFLANLQWYIESELRSLTVVHLHAIVHLCNQILTDPFIEYSPELIKATCSVVETVIQWAWPRLQEYRYTLMLGLTKARALDTRAFTMLNPTPQEKETLMTFLSA